MPGARVGDYFHEKDDYMYEQRVWCTGTCRLKYENNKVL